MWRTGIPKRGRRCGGGDQGRSFCADREGLLKLKEVQLEGKRRMACDAFLRGYSLKDTDQLGE